MNLLTSPPVITYLKIKLPVNYSRSSLNTIFDVASQRAILKALGMPEAPSAKLEQLT